MRSTPPHHGFTFPTRHCYDKSAAERVWERVFALFRRRLEMSAG